MRAGLALWISIGALAAGCAQVHGTAPPAPGDAARADASVRDAGMDAARDAGIDAALLTHDAGLDAPIGLADARPGDAAHDAGSDAPVDLGVAGDADVACSLVGTFHADLGFYTAFTAAGEWDSSSSPAGPSEAGGTYVLAGDLLTFYSRDLIPGCADASTSYAIERRGCDMVVLHFVSDSCGRTGGDVRMAWHPHFGR